MKNLIRKFLLVVLSALMVFLICGVFIKKTKAEKVFDRIKTLPDLVLLDILGDTIRTSQIHTGPVLITFFNPECDYCKYEITSLLSSTHIDRQLTILLISYADRSEILSFIRQFDIDSTSNLYLLHDPDFRMSNLFKANVMPSNYIYNDSLQLVKIFKGSTKPEALMRYMFNDDKRQEN
ncbi:MAG TPA: TlpA disulfide reductase family protein [Saprospiraceae bacterium]|jgi:thiol-disulfide isomerase/thioredoxin|nr:TlpA family protein disulfide reductase [Clostridiaceae bacterium]HMT77796.1 TlpA disulfide reductase family protein [Saprospiraceae bacterium]HQK69413.1 TlpA disulfide reductase family protein [Bacteroidales bacterium]